MLVKQTEILPLGEEGKMGRGNQGQRDSKRRNYTQNRVIREGAGVVGDSEPVAQQTYTLTSYS